MDKTERVFILLIGGNISDNYVPGNVISASPFLRPNLPPPLPPPQPGVPAVNGMDCVNNAFDSLQMSIEKQLPPEHLRARRLQEKSEQIQFLHNVHFPERHQGPSVNQGLVSSNTNNPAFLYCVLYMRMQICTIYKTKLKTNFFGDS